jgi:hypothetical protein
MGDGGAAVRLSRRQVLAHRVRVQQLDRAAGTVEDTAVLDLGVQDTGPDGALWALALRGVVDPRPEDLALAWTVRGAPHLYRRADLPSVARAVQPWSDADAGKRIFDASKPLKAAGIGGLAALDQVASALRSVVTRPTVKGDVSAALNARLPEPYLRYCRPCDAIHVFEQPFRLAALRAGLELEPGTSPPVLRPVDDFAPADEAESRHDVVRGYLHLLGPATHKDVAGYLDAPVTEVRGRWPSDAVEVQVEGSPAWALEADLPSLLEGGPVQATRLLGPFDLLLQGRDRSLLVEDPARAKAMWPVLGRPGAVLADGDLVGTWRPRQSSGRLRIELDLWGELPDPAALEEQAARLAAHRTVELAGVDLAGGAPAGAGRARGRSARSRGAAGR